MYNNNFLTTFLLLLLVVLLLLGFSSRIPKATFARLSSTMMRSGLCECVFYSVFFLQLLCFLCVECRRTHTFFFCIRFVRHPNHHHRYALLGLHCLATLRPIVIVLQFPSDGCACSSHCEYARAFMRNAINTYSKFVHFYDNRQFSPIFNKSNEAAKNDAFWVN